MPGIDETGQSWRVRQRSPGVFEKGSFRTIELADGVKAVIGRPKSTSSTTGVGDDGVSLADGTVDTVDTVKKKRGAWAVPSRWRAGA